jgi:hypothetical protein
MIVIDCAMYGIHTHLLVLKECSEICRWYLMNFELGVLFFTDFESYIRRNRYACHLVYWEAMKIGK